MDDQATILIVDDDLGPRESLRMILKPHYQVLTAADGRSALEILYSRPLDVVTLDLKMPGIPGLDLLRAIKQHDPRIEVIIVTGYGTVSTAIEAIRHGVVDYLLKPFNVFDILSAIDRALERRKVTALVDRTLAAAPADREALASLQALAGEAVTDGVPGAPAAPADRERYLEFLKVLACTLENKDEYTHGHSGRVTYYAGLIAERLGLDDRSRRNLQAAAFLHDIGKLGISNSVVGKEDRLTERERRLIQEHPEKGVSLIEHLAIPREVLEIIRHHHERWDGGGYPHGLRGSDIPAGALIVALADAYDAMSSHRPYRRALSRDAIRAELQRCAGSHFSPELVEVFLQVIAEEEILGGVAGVAAPVQMHATGGAAS